MKRKIRIIFVSMVALVILCLSACAKVEFKVNFVVDGEIYATVNTNGNEVIKVPQNPTKEGYSFDGWYWDDSVWQKPFTANSLLDVPLSSDMNVYAKWEEINDNPPPVLEGNSADISSIALTIEGDKAALVVSNDTETFSFLNDITVAPNASYVLAKDIGCESLIASKTVALAEGDNTYYILVTNGDTQKLYTVTIRRRPIYTVIFNSNNGTSVPSQHIEEGNFATIPKTTREGYKFSAWDYDFSNPITQEITINASWIPNSDTAYKVEYYLENLNKNGYDLYETDNLTGVTDTEATAAIKTYEHFTHISSQSHLTGTVAADGSLVLKVYYTRNTYTVTTRMPQDAVGTITQGNTYPYGTEITILATWVDGFSFSGLFDNGVKLTAESSYTFVVNKNIEIYANITPNDETPYTVEYYLENLSKTGYDKVHTDILNGKTNTQAVAIVKEYEHFTYNSQKSNTYGNISGNGSLVLKVYYTRNRYTVSTSTNIGNITEGGTYPYGTEITIKVTFAAGYYFNGFFENQVKIHESDEYTFVVDQNREIRGSVKICDDTPYKVEYYTAKLGQAGYDLYDTITYTGTTDSIISATLIPIEGFSYNSGNEYKQIKGDGSLVFKVYYTRNTYTITKEMSSEGDITTYGEYEYGTFVELTATPCRGYEITGWYIDGNLISEAATLVYEVKGDITVATAYKVTEEMSNFEFTSSIQTCVITGIKDTTVTTIKVPSYVTQIEYAAFTNCSNVTSITLPFVGRSATENRNTYGVFGYIFGCEKFDKTALTTSQYSNSSSKTVDYYVPTSLTEVTITNDCGVSYGAFYNCTFIESIVFIGENTYFDEYTFYNCTNLKNVVLPSKLTKITWASFNYCASLQSIDIPETVTNLQPNAFAYSGLKSIVLPEGITYIWSVTFRGCRDLEYIVIEGKLTNIAYMAFDSCSSLKNVYFSGSATDWANVYKENVDAPLAAATIYSYSQTEPSTEGNYWHYVNGVPTPWTAEQANSPQ